MMNFSIKKFIPAKQPIKWAKMQGAGNSFLITSFNATLWNKQGEKDWSKISQKLCTQAPYADGLIVLNHIAQQDFQWLFYNSDGSTAEMCGNGVCCVLSYIFQKNLITGTHLNLKTSAGQLRGEWMPDRQAGRFFVQQSPDIQGPFELSFKNEKISYMFINSSVPHAVIKTTSLSLHKEDLIQRKEMCQYLRKQNQHDENGMNVSFYCPTKQINHIMGCSFERGVEDFTLACGTGALAIAQTYQKKDLKQKQNPIYVQMPGGILEVQFHSNNEISLMSPVEWLKEFEKEI